MGTVLILDSEEKLTGAMPYEQVRASMDVENDRTIVSAIIEYSEYRWTQCRDAGAFKINTFPNIVIKKESISILNALIAISGYISNEHILEMECF